MIDKDGTEIFYTPGEVNCLGDVVKNVGVKGEIIEVGVYKGGSAKVIAGHFKDRIVHLFDTFTGFPNDIDFKNGDAEWYKEGDMKEANIELVKKNLSKFKNIEFHKGRFPDTADVIKGKIAFAHIDVDIYTGTKEALEFIYPKMVKGGSIVIHDYPAHKGVENAVNNFLEDKEHKIEILGVEGRQGIIKI